MKTPRRGPRGGSFVILTLTCITATGKCGLGFDVSQSRKLSWTWSGLKSSTMRSNVGNHDTQRWQFCRRTQEPSFVLFSMSFSAMAPWPCPRAMEVHLSSMDRFRASSWISLFGSLPVDKINTNGVIFSESS